MNDTDFPLPEGFHEHISPSNFVLTLGPMYKREAADGCSIIAIRVLECHLNLHGLAHGGLVATLIDNAIGYNVARAYNGSIVTAQLSIDYLASARQGDWIEAHVQINRQGRRMCFAECRLLNAGALIARASCILVPRG